MNNKFKYLLNLCIMFGRSHFALILLFSSLLISCSSSENTLDKRYYDLVLREQRNFVQLDTLRLNELAVLYVIEGSKLQQQNKYAESILEFQEAMKYDSSASILFAIAKSYLMLGRYELSFQYIINALNKEPEFIPAMELLTELYVYKNNIKDAITVYQSIYDLEPTRQRKSYLARIYEYDNIEKAIELYEELLNQREEVDILYRIAGLYDKNKDTAKMIQSYEKLIQYSGNKPEAYDALIRTYLEHSDYEKAFQILDTARFNFLEKDINYFYNVTGNVLLDDTNEIALKYIPKLLKIVTENYYFDWKMNMIAGYLADKIKDTTMTDRFFGRALKADTIPDISLSVVLYYSRISNYEKALSILDEFQPKFPDNYYFPFYRGLMYHNMDSTGLALNYYYAALSLDSNNLEILSQLGLLYDQKKKYDSCDIVYLKILSFNPNNALINNNYAYSLAVRGEKLDTALIMSQKSLSIEPDNPSYLDTYGWIQYQIGNYELALDYILKAIQSGEENSEVLGHLGYVYLKLGMRDDAINAWEKSLTYEPDNTEIIEQLELLK